MSKKNLTCIPSRRHDRAFVIKIVKKMAEGAACRLKILLVLYNL